ncbi:TetR/AcrR family transcriptional regulator [Lapidilactobacillus mulanensis]|uniref:TetR/AcrR family transcriptional regulator n=1 Tax=Lapidilactobacillus mulanensis TaxID=2485999 RepID=A0ABW4DP83_9LACO|nr:TetR family transcriptional regulator [Lapidilactobacillus mulanensis]
MARKKTIMKHDILNAAFNLAMRDGFQNFTARNVAEELNCSTQPLYLEFNSMQDLKRQSIKKIQAHLLKTVFNRHYDDDPMINLDLAYIHFVCEQPLLYRTLWIEDKESVQEMKQFAHRLGMSRLRQKAEAANLSDEKMERILIGNLIIANGIANLLSTGYVKITKTQMKEILNAQLADFIYNDRFNPDNEAADEELFSCDYENEAI